MDRKLNKLIQTALILAGFFVIFASQTAIASWYCEPVYGGGERCWGTGEIIIDKVVRNPGTGAFVDNLGVNDPKFAPDQEVLYQIQVKNIGQGTFAKVNVKDTFPNYLDFVWGPLGWDANARELRFDLSDLKPGETRKFEVMAKVFGTSRLPEDKSLICVVNTARVEAEGKSDEDQAQICFEKKVLGVTQLPPTGQVQGLMIAFGLIVTTLMGAKLAFVKQKAN